MSTQDMDILARKIVSLEKRHNSLARAQQLPNSSVRIVDGDDVGLSDAVESVKDTSDETANLGEWLYDADSNIDNEAEHSVDIPDWIQEAGNVGDVAWEVGQEAFNRVEVAQAAANSAASDALAASQAASNAAAKAQQAIDAANLAVVSSIIEYAVNQSDTEPPTMGWSVDNPETSDGDFVWMRTVVTYGDDTTSTSTPVLMSRGGGEVVKIESLTTFYTLVDNDPVVVPPAPTTLNPGSPWSVEDPAWVEGKALVYVERVVYDDGSFSYTVPRVNNEWFAAGQALKEAVDARFLAEGLYQTIPSEIEPTQRPNGSALVQGDQWWVIGTSAEDEGKFIGVRVYDGNNWVDRQLVADSLLVPGSVGAILIGDGMVTAPKLSSDAIDFKVAQGLQLYSSYIESPNIASSDKLGSGANKLNDPEFQGSVDSAWVASGHTGDPEITQRDNITWNQTWRYPDLYPPTMHTYRNQGNVTAYTRLMPGTRKTGSLLFSNYSWFNNTTRNFSNPHTFTDKTWSEGIAVGSGQFDPSLKVPNTPAIKTPVAKTTYITNTAIIPVTVGSRWNIRLSFTRLTSTQLNHINGIYIEIINNSTNSVLWSHELAEHELMAGQTNVWWDSNTNSSVRYRIKTVYTAAGGGGTQIGGVAAGRASLRREVAPSSTAGQTKDGVTSVSWSASTGQWYNPFTLTAISGEGWGSVNGALGSEYASRATLAIEATNAVFAEVEPEKGWKLTADSGLEFFNTLGARTARFDGEDNFFTGRMASKEDGARWEITDTNLRLYNNTNTEIGSLVAATNGITISADTLTLNAHNINLGGATNFNGVVTGVHNRGTALERAATTPKYFDFWHDTDGNQYTWVGGKSGNWRRYSGRRTSDLAPWSTSANSIFGRTTSDVLETVLEDNETLAIVGGLGSSGYDVMSLISVTKNATNTSVTYRIIRFLHASQTRVSFAWHIVPGTN